GVAEIPVSHKQIALDPVGQVPVEAVPQIRKETINLPVRQEKLQLVLVPKALVKSPLRKSAHHASAIAPEVVKKILKLVR
ncbi:MAG: hypothetical protein JZU67_06495, partial [Burkholderiaceae bacterium]|nr:hypothetical protein [Burkholderiaceae bacterium]